MKICLINNSYKPFSRGGADRVAEIIANGLAERGHGVFVIATKPFFKNLPIRPARPPCPLSETGLRQADAGNSRLPIYFIPGFFYYLNQIPAIFRIFWHLIDMFDIGTCYKVKSIFKKEKPDIVITNNLKGLSYLLPRLFKRMRIRHIHILHDVQLIHPSGLLICGREELPHNQAAAYYARLCVLIFGSPEVVISPSAWLLEAHLSMGFFRKSQCQVMRNPVETVEPVLKKPKSGGKMRFVYVGQIEEHKGVKLLIDAFSSIYGNDPAAGLTIIGAGSLKEDLAGRYSGYNNIDFTGKLECKADILSKLSASDVLIVPSICHENSPTVIYEAVQAGIPVLGSDSSGIKELIEEFGGYTFKTGNSADLGKRLVELTEKARRGALSIPDASKLSGYNIMKYIGFLEKYFK